MRKDVGEKGPGRCSLGKQAHPWGDRDPDPTLHLNQALPGRWHLAQCPLCPSLPWDPRRQGRCPKEDKGVVGRLGWGWGHGRLCFAVREAGTGAEVQPPARVSCLAGLGLRPLGHVKRNLSEPSGTPTLPYSGLKRLNLCMLSPESTGAQSQAVRSRGCN